MDIQKRAIKNFFKSLQKLHEVGVLKNKHSFTCQIGEWLVEQLYEGERAKSGIQKGWDVDVNGFHIQVKAHAKAEGNSNRYSAIEKNETDKIDELIIIEFSQYYKIKSFYKAPWVEAIKYIELKNKKNKRYQISWSKLDSYRIKIEDLPKQDIISIFNK